MPVPGPRGQHQQQPGILDRLHLMALFRVEDRQQTRSARGPLAIRRVELDIAVDDEQPGTLVHLMLLELLALGQVDDDRAPLGLGVEDLRRVRLHLQLVEVPAVHRHAALYIQVRCRRNPTCEGAPQARPV
jgi:hypothetical protein